MNVKHIFFDLDHTLWDFEKNSALTFQKIFQEIGLRVNLEVFLEKYVPINLEFWRLYREDKISKKELRYQRLKTTFDTIGLQVSNDVINQLSVLYIENLPTFNHLFNGAIELLDYLAVKYTLHIITNGFEEVQTKKMKASGIIHYFKEIITSESVGVKKPNPKIFRWALTKAVATTDNSIMIGDSYEADILGAQAIGLDTIFCNFDTKIVPNNLSKTVTSLKEIKQYL